MEKTIANTTCEKCGASMPLSEAEEWRWCQNCRAQDATVKESTITPDDLKSSATHKNMYATLLKVLGVLTIIVGFALGLYLGNLLADYRVLFMLTFASAISGCLLLGLGEIIRILSKALFSIENH